MKSQGDFSKTLLQRCSFLSALLESTFFCLYYVFETKHRLLMPRKLSLLSKPNLKPQPVFPAGLFGVWQYLAYLDAYRAERVFKSYTKCYPQ